MTRKLAGIAALFALFLSAVGTGATAHTSANSTELSINYAISDGPRGGEDRVLIYGRLYSASRACREGQVVTVRDANTGAVLGSDLTDAEGEYSVIFDAPEGSEFVVYSTFAGSVSTSYGHSHRCGASRSSTIRFVVE